MSFQKVLWVKIWEKFAGKQYSKPKSLKPGTIRNTVKEVVSDAQELLFDMNKTISNDIRFREWHPKFGYLDAETYEQGSPATYPQSLGELCIELAQDEIRHITMEYEPPKGFWVAWPVLIRDLRKAMYHKHRDTQKEKRLYRADAILSLVINDLSCGELCSRGLTWKP